MDKKKVMSMLNNSIDYNSLNILQSDEMAGTTYADGTTAATGDYYPGCWDYWQNCYYPQIIYPSYPVYIQERAKDNGKKAFEIIKMLADKKMVKLDKVKDFIDLMDLLIKIL